MATKKLIAPLKSYVKITLPIYYLVEGGACKLNLFELISVNACCHMDVRNKWLINSAHANRIRYKLYFIITLHLIDI